MGGSVEGQCRECYFSDDLIILLLIPFSFQRNLEERLFQSYVPELNDIAVEIRGSRRCEGWS